MSELLSLEVGLALCLGIGLSAAAGFRVFVPPLLLAIAVKLGAPGASSAPEWLGSWPAIIALGTAALVELVAYYVPWLDNALDTVASPLAVGAGVLLTAGVLEGVEPMWRWSLAVVAGGGAAGVTQTATVITRAFSSATTGGLANFVVSSLEAVAALALTVLTLLIAPLALLVFVGLVVWLVRLVRRRRARRTAAASA